VLEDGCIEEGGDLSGKQTVKHGEIAQKEERTTGRIDVQDKRGKALNEK